MTTPTSNPISSALISPTPTLSCNDSLPLRTVQAESLGLTLEDEDGGVQGVTDVKDPGNAQLYTTAQLARRTRLNASQLVFGDVWNR